MQDVTAYRDHRGGPSPPAPGGATHRTPVPRGRALFAAAAPSAEGAPHAALLAFAATCAVVGAATWRVDWGSLPDPVIGVLPYVGGGVVTAVGLAAPTATGLSAVLLGLVVMYRGVAFHRARFLTALGLGSLALAGTTLAANPGAARLWQLVGTLITTASIGSALHWLRGLMDADADAAISAQTDLGRQQLSAEEERERATEHAAETLRSELAQRASLSSQVVEHSTALAVAAEEVSLQTSSVATASQQMSAVLDRLAATAQSSEAITRSVTAGAAHAGEVMAVLAASSRWIFAASELIQASAEQTDLLALNAPSSRPGPARPGAASLSEIPSQVETAVAAVAQITDSMASLAEHNVTLATGVAQQSAAVQNVAHTIEETAAHARTMAQGVEALEGLARQC